MSWAVKLVQQICKVFSTATERFLFIQHLENTFSEVTREIFEFSITGGSTFLGCEFHLVKVFSSSQQN